MAPSQCVGLLCYGSVSSSPRGGAGEATVWLFLFLRLFDALSTSALRVPAEQRKRRPKTRFNISTSTNQFSNKDNTRTFPPITAVGHHWQRERRPSKGKSILGRSERIKLITGSDLSFPPCFMNTGWGYSWGCLRFPLVLFVPCQIIALVVDGALSGPHCLGTAGLRCADGAVL